MFNPLVQYIWKNKGISLTILVFVFVLIGIIIYYTINYTNNKKKVVKKHKSREERMIEEQIKRTEPIRANAGAVPQLSWGQEQGLTPEEIFMQQQQQQFMRHQEMLRQRELLNRQSQQAQMALIAEQNTAVAKQKVTGPGPVTEEEEDNEMIKKLAADIMNKNQAPIEEVEDIEYEGNRVQESDSESEPLKQEQKEVELAPVLVPVPKPVPEVEEKKQEPVPVQVVEPKSEPEPEPESESESESEPEREIIIATPKVIPPPSPKPAVEIVLEKQVKKCGFVPRAGRTAGKMCNAEFNDLSNSLYCPKHRK